MDHSPFLINILNFFFKWQFETAAGFHCSCDEQDFPFHCIILYKINANVLINNKYINLICNFNYVIRVIIINNTKISTFQLQRPL